MKSAAIEDSLGVRTMPLHIGKYLSHVFLSALLGALACGITVATAATTKGVGAGGFPLLTLNEIVVTGTNAAVSAADAELNKQVEAAMKNDRYFYDYHVAVSTQNGVVFLRGLVFDEWDVRTAIRLSKRVAGVKRVINQLQIGALP
jgi:hypothetical protein